MNKDTEETIRIFKLERAIKDLHWMALRYVDGRSTYAVEMFNQIVLELNQMGIHISPSDGKLFARDGMFPLEKIYEEVERKITEKHE